MTATTTAAKSGASRTCAKCGAGAACKCCSTTCAPYADDQFCQSSGLSRPRFFAGQLLTEEDLQDLGDYVLAKNRLHNRYLIGAGVVCGLEVGLHPCDPRAVTVAPGYALDCCGNDITVPCPVDSLDIIAMIQELRTGLRGGYDCGDPCRKDPADAPKDVVRPQIYDLYVRYCERNTDLVTPYELESCAAPNCQASRVAEGFKFELRCAPLACVETTPVNGQKATKVGYAEITDGGPVTLVKKLVDCLDNENLKKLVKDTFTSLYLFETLSKSFLQADLVLDPAYRPNLATDAKNQLKDAARALETANPVFALEAIHRGLTCTIRAKVVTGASPTEAEISPLTTKLADLVRNPIVAKDAAAVTALWDRYKNLTAALPAFSLDDRAALAGEFLKLTDVADAVTTLNNSLGAVNRLHQDGVLRLDDTQASFVRDYRFSTIDPAITHARFAEVREAALKFAYIVYTNARKCLCAAPHVPCLPCDDPAVRLARMEVDLDNCKILDICDLNRDFAITGAGIRYWFNQLQDWFGFFRTICCLPYEKRHPRFDLKTELAKDAETQWRHDDRRVDRWRTMPAPNNALDSIGVLTERVRVIAQVPTPDVSAAINPLGTAVDPSAALVEMQATINKLNDQVAKLEQALTQQTDQSRRIDKLQADFDKEVKVVSVMEKWLIVGTENVKKRKEFLKAEFEERLTTEGLKALQKASAVAKKLKTVEGAHVKTLADVPTAFRTKWGGLMVPVLLRDEVKLLKEVDDATLPADEIDSIDIFLRDLRELDFLLDSWPANKIADGELI